MDYTIANEVCNNPDDMHHKPSYMCDNSIESCNRLSDTCTTQVAFTLRSSGVCSTSNGTCIFHMSLHVYNSRDMYDESDDVCNKIK